MPVMKSSSSPRDGSSVWGPKAHRQKISGVSRSGKSGLESFTLVEVVIAIGVTTFVLISILGLMTYASQMVKQSDKYSRLSTVAGQVVATLERQPFTLSAAQANTNVAFYYDFEGLPTNSAAAFYQCNVTNASPASFALTNVEPIQITICWPKTSASAFANTNIIVSAILNYD